jgi:hypothetical protein
MDENVRLTDDGRAHAAPKEGKCANCGAVWDQVGAVCLDCLNRRYYDESIARQREIVARYPNLSLEFNKASQQRLPKRLSRYRTARPQKGSMTIWHLILGANRRLGWCGKVLAAKQADCRIPGSQRFPANMCQQCLQVYFQLTGQRGVV